MALTTGPAVGASATVAYCDLSVADGAGSGTSGSPWSWGDAQTNIASWEVLYVRGNGSFTSTQTMGGGTTTFKVYIGCNSSWNAVSGPRDANIPTFDFSGQSSGDGINVTPAMVQAYGLKVINAFSDGIQTTTATLLCGCYVADSGVLGIRGGASNTIAYCVVTGNGGYGALVTTDSVVCYCESYDNASTGFVLGGASGHSINNFSHGDGAGVDVITNYCSVINNTIDAGASSGINYTARPGMYIGNIFSNMSGVGNYAIGLSSGTSLAFLSAYNNFYNNTANYSDINSTPKQVSVYEGAQDPSYENISATPPDYAISGTDLLKAFASILPNNQLNIGAYQEGGGAAPTGGGGLIVHPGMLGGLRG